MWSFLASLLGGLAIGGLNMAGSAIGASSAASSSDKAAEQAYKSQQETNALNYQMFKENQAWQERMANTAHQREVQDLREAGLNPILSATGGSGAATPNIATPSAVSPGSSVADKAAIYSSLASGITNSVNSAVDAALKLSRVDLNLVNSSKLAKERDKEVGKRNPFNWAVNTIDSNSKNLSDFAKEAGGLLTDIYQGMRTQLNYTQKLFQYNSARGIKSSGGTHDFGLSDQMNGVRIE